MNVTEEFKRCKQQAIDNDREESICPLCDCSLVKVGTQGFRKCVNCSYFDNGEVYRRTK